MTDKITWTHVDKLVRKEIEDRGQLAIGLTDAEVAYNLLKFLLKDCEQNKAAAATLAVRYDLRNAEYEALRREILTPEKTGKKTKQRITDLEKAVEALQKCAFSKLCDATYEAMLKGPSDEKANK